MSETNTNEAAAANESATATTESTGGSTSTGGGKKRPTFLTVLCILTFIGSGLGILGSLFMLIGMGSMMSFLGDIGGMGSAGTAYSVVSLLLSAVSLFGAIQMWKLKKMGFYLYTAAAILLVVFPLFFGMPFSTFGAVIAVLFIVLYGLNLKHME